MRQIRAHFVAVSGTGDVVTDYDTRAQDAQLVAQALDAHGSQLALAAAIAYRRETVGRWVALARDGRLRLTPRARRDVRASLPPDVPQPEE